MQAHSHESGSRDLAVFVGDFSLRLAVFSGYLAAPMPMPPCARCSWALHLRTFTCCVCARNYSGCRDGGSNCKRTKSTLRLVASLRYTESACGAALNISAQKKDAGRKGAHQRFGRAAESDPSLEFFRRLTFSGVCAMRGGLSMAI